MEKLTNSYYFVNDGVGLVLKTVTIITTTVNISIARYSKSFFGKDRFETLASRIGEEDIDNLLLVLTKHIENSKAVVTNTTSANVSLITSFNGWCLESTKILIPSCTDINTLTPLTVSMVDGRLTNDKIEMFLTTKDMGSLMELIKDSLKFIKILNP